MDLRNDTLAVMEHKTIKLASCHGKIDVAEMSCQQHIHILVCTLFLPEYKK